MENKKWSQPMWVSDCDEHLVEGDEHQVESEHRVEEGKHWVEVGDEYQVEDEHQVEKKEQVAVLSVLLASVCEQVNQVTLEKN